MRILMVLAIMGVCTCGAAADNLKQVVDAVAAQNGGLAAARSDVEAARDQLTVARSVRYPRLSIRSSLTRGDNPVYVFGSLLEQQSFGPANFAIDSLNHPDYLTNIKNALDIGVPIFAAFEISNGITAADLAYQQASDQWKITDQNVRFQAINAYLQILLKTAVRRNLEERISSSEGEVESARKLNARGLVLGSDFYAAQALLSALRAQKAQADRELAAAETSLRILMGRPGSAFSGGLSTTPYVVANDDEVMRQALLSRREPAQAASQTSMAESGLMQTGRSFLPKIEAFASLETNTEDFSANPTNRMIGVKSNFPLGDPTYFSRRKAARAELDSARGREESAKEAVRLDVVRSVAAYSGAVDALPLVEQTAEQARKSLQLFRPLYREGRQSILDVLRAEEALYRADRAVAETAFQIHSGYARLLLAAGLLDTAATEKIAAAIGADQ